jgi:hypothetical protein
MLDINQNGRIELQQYLEIAKDDPSTVEIFDFLNGGIAETIISSKTKNEDE